MITFSNVKPRLTNTTFSWPPPFPFRQTLFLVLGCPPTGHSSPSDINLLVINAPPPFPTNTHTHIKNLTTILLCTVEPRFNKGPRNWQNVFAISRFHHIKVLFHVSYYDWDKENCSL